MIAQVKIVMAAEKVTGKKRKVGFVTLRKDDEYMTPRYALRDMLTYVNIDPAKDTLFEPFYGTGRSSIVMKELGYEVVPGKEVEFFDVAFPDEANHILVTNPPFSIKRKVLDYIITQKKCRRFAILLPSPTIFAAYFHEMIRAQNLVVSVLIPNARIQFVKNGKKTRCNALDTCWITAGIDLPDAGGGSHFPPAVGPRDG